MMSWAITSASPASKTAPRTGDERAPIPTCNDPVAPSRSSRRLATAMWRSMATSSPRDAMLTANATLTIRMYSP